jgi:hypothetical protein
MKNILQKLYVQRKIWRGHNMNSLCWAIYCVNDGKKVEIGSHQIMRCIMCYDNVVNIPNWKTKERRGLITYYKTYGITTLKKHVNANHFAIAKKFEKEIDNEIIESVERNLRKKDQMS